MKLKANGLLNTEPSGRLTCGACGCELNNPCDPLNSQDLGGDCAECMLAVEDPDAIEFYEKFKSNKTCKAAIKRIWQLPALKAG